MKIELLSYRLLRCRFFFFLFCFGEASAVLYFPCSCCLMTTKTTPFVLIELVPQLLFWNQLLLYFLSLPPSPCRATSQQSIELKEFSSFLFYFNANSTKTSSDVLGTKHERNFHSILSSSTQSPRPVPQTQRFDWEGFYFFNNNGRDDRHVDRGTTRRPL